MSNNSVYDHHNQDDVSIINFNLLGIKFHYQGHVPMTIKVSASLGAVSGLAMGASLFSLGSSVYTGVHLF